MKKLSVACTLIIALAVVLMSCSAVDDTAAKNKAIVLQSLEAINSQNFDKLDEFMAQDYVRHSQATPDVKVESLADFKALLSEWFTTFPDAKQGITLLAAEGDLVAFYGSFIGTQTGPMEGFPITGKTIDSETAGFHRLENGKIVETWVTWDNIAILSQLGLFPPPAAGSGE